MSTFSNQPKSEESVNDYGYPFWTHPHTVYTAKDLADNKGFPTRCRCGGDVEIAFANSASQKYKRYYKCILAQDGEYHTFKWVDETMEEEIRTIKNANIALEARINSFTLGLDGDQKDPASMWSLVEYLKADMDVTKDRLHDLQDSIERWCACWKPRGVIVGPMMVCFLAIIIYIIIVLAK